MTRQTAQPLQALRLETQTRRAKYLSDLYLSGELTLDTPYQRDAVWTEDQQVALIYSFLTGLPIPGVVINNRALAGWPENASRPGEIYAAIDGKQRILTLSRWFSGLLSVPSSWFKSEDIENQPTATTPDGPMLTYLDLSKPARLDQSFNFTIGVSEGHLPSLAEEAKVFVLVNGGGTPQAELTLQRARDLVSKEL